MAVLLSMLIGALLPIAGASHDTCVSPTAYGPGTIVAGPDPDVALSAVALVADADVLDLNGNARADPGDILVLDLTTPGAIGIGDLYLSGPQRGTPVRAGDRYANTPLLETQHAPRYWDRNDNDRLDEGDDIFWAQGTRVAAGDVWVTTSRAGEIVVMGSVESTHGQLDGPVGRVAELRRAGNDSTFYVRWGEEAHILPMDARLTRFACTPPSTPPLGPASLTFAFGEDGAEVIGLDRPLDWSDLTASGCARLAWTRAGASTPRPQDDVRLGDGISACAPGETLVVRHKNASAPLATHTFPRPPARAEPDPPLPTLPDPCLSKQDLAKLDVTQAPTVEELLAMPRLSPIALSSPMGTDPVNEESATGLLRYWPLAIALAVAVGILLFVRSRRRPPTLALFLVALLLAPVANAAPTLLDSIEIGEAGFTPDADLEMGRFTLEIHSVTDGARDVTVTFIVDNSTVGLPVPVSLAPRGSTTVHSPPWRLSPTAHDVEMRVLSNEERHTVRTSLDLATIARTPEFHAATCLVADSATGGLRLRVDVENAGPASGAALGIVIDGKVAAFEPLPAVGAGIPTTIETSSLAAGDLAGREVRLVVFGQRAERQGAKFLDNVGRPAALLGGSLGAHDVRGPIGQGTLHASVAPSAATLVQGEPARFVVTIERAGGIGTRDVAVRIDLDGKTVSTHRVGIAPDRTTSVMSALWSAIEGTHQLEARVHYADGSEATVAKTSLRVAGGGGP